MVSGLQGAILVLTLHVVSAADLSSFLGLSSIRWGLTNVTIQSQWKSAHESTWEPRSTVQCYGCSFGRCVLGGSALGSAG